jgi:hypothetical protein
MQDISSIGHGSVGPINRAGLIHQGQHDNGQARAAPGAGSLSDRVELSDHAQLLTRLRELPGVRPQLIESVRAAIATGAYESTDKIDVTVARLLDEFSQ